MFWCRRHRETVLERDGGGVMRYDPSSIANYFLHLALSDENKDKLTHMKLQKLVYYAHGFCLALFDRPLIDEQFQAWPYGPVAPSLYVELRSYGSDPVTKPAKLLRSNGVSYYKETASPPSEPNLCRVLNKVYEKYKLQTAGQLSKATHQPETPWSIVTENGKYKNSFLPIDDELIKNYFKNFIKSPSRV